MQFRIAVSDYQTQSDAIRAVRSDVFLREQAIPPELEFDAHDLTCVHVVVYESDRPVATGRLDLVQNGRIGRVAVLSDFRRRGLGTMVMQALEQQASESKLKKIWFHAQVIAVPFYQSLGYQVTGEEFLEAGIRHLSMEKSL